MCPIEPDLLYWAMTLSAIFFALYLGSRNQANPYLDKNVFRDAKAGNFWAKVCVCYSVGFGVLLIAFFGCLV